MRTYFTYMSKAHLSEQQLETVHTYRRSLMEKKQAELQDRYRRALENAEDREGSCPKRDVTPVWRLCIADSLDGPGSGVSLFSVTSDVFSFFNVFIIVYWNTDLKWCCSSLPVEPLETFLGSSVSTEGRLSIQSLQPHHVRWKETWREDNCSAEWDKENTVSGPTGRPTSWAHLVHTWNCRRSYIFRYMVDIICNMCFVLSFRLLRNGCQHVFNRGSLPILWIFKTQNSSRCVERLISQDMLSAS